MGYVININFFSPNNFKGSYHTGVVYFGSEGRIDNAWIDIATGGV